VLKLAEPDQHVVTAAAAKLFLGVASRQTRSFEACCCIDPSARHRASARRARVLSRLRF
jgi:hypothetical protein